MPYEVGIKLNVSGQDALAQIPRVMEQIRASSGDAAKYATIFESVLRSEVAAGKSLGDALKELSNTTVLGSRAFQGMARDILNAGSATGTLTKEAQKAQAEIQKLGRMQEQAHQENIRRSQRMRDEQRRSDESTATALSRALNLGATGNGGFSIISGGLRSIAGEFGTVGLAAGAAGVAIGIASKAGIDIVRDFASAGRETENLAERLGITTSQARTLENEARLSGVNIGRLEASARTLAAALESDSSQGRTAADALKRLGIATETSSGEIREMGPVLLEVLEKLSHVKNHTDLVREATQLLGRGAIEIVPLIEHYKEYQETLKRLGITMDDSFIAKAVEADKRFRELSLTWDAFKQKIGEKLEPIVVDLLVHLTNDLNGKFKENIVRDEAGLMAAVASTLGILKPGSGVSPQAQQPADLAENRRKIIESRKQFIAQFDDDSPQARYRKAESEFQKNLKLAGESRAPLTDDEKSKLSIEAEHVKSLKAQAEASKESESATKRATSALHSFVQGMANVAESPLAKIQNRYADFVGSKDYHALSPAQRAAADKEYGEAIRREEQQMIDAAHKAEAERARKEAERAQKWDNLIEESIGISDKLGKGESQQILGQNDPQSFLYKFFAGKDLSLAPLQRTGAQVAQDIQRDAKFSTRLTELQGRPGDEVETANKVAVIERQAADAERAARIGALGMIDDEAQRKQELFNIELDHNRQLQDIEQERILKAYELRKQQEDAYVNAAKAGFTALVTGGAGGLQSLLKSQLVGFGSTIAGNLARETYGAFGDKFSLTSDPKSPLGRILAGTPFGAHPKLEALPDKVDTSNTLLGMIAKNTSLLATGTDGAVGSVPGIGGIPGSGVLSPGGLLGSIFGGSTNNPFVFNANATGVAADAASFGIPNIGISPNGAAAGSGQYGGFRGALAGLGHTGDLQGIFTGISSRGGQAETLSTSERVGAAVGTAGVVAGGTEAAYGGFKRGGAKGDLQGVSAVAGTAAALDPEPISKTVLGAVALATGLISSLFGDPVANRQNQISKELGNAHYNAPTPLEYNFDSAGNYTDYGADGKLRQSPFRGVPQVTQPYQWYHNGGYQQFPGTVTSPYTQQPPPQVNITVHAMDAKSFLDRSPEILAAAAHGLNHGHGTQFTSTIGSHLGIR